MLFSFPFRSLPSNPNPLLFILSLYFPQHVYYTKLLIYIYKSCVRLISFFILLLLLLLLFMLSTQHPIRRIEQARADFFPTLSHWKMLIKRQICYFEFNSIYALLFTVTSFYSHGRNRRGYPFEILHGHQNWWKNGNKTISFFRHQ